MEDTTSQGTSAFGRQDFQNQGERPRSDQGRGAEGGGAGDAGRSMVQQGASTVKETVRQVGTQVRGAGRDVRQTIDSLVERGANQACDQVGAAASALHSAAENLEDSQPSVARLTHNMAGRLERVTDYLQGRRPSEIVDDIEGFARREPLLFLGGAVLLGAVIGRVIKASSAGARGPGRDRFDTNRFGAQTDTGGISSFEQSGRPDMGTSHPPHESGIPGPSQGGQGAAGTPGPMPDPMGGTGALGGPGAMDGPGCNPAGLGGVP